MKKQQQLVRTLQEQGVCTSAELQQALGLSQPTVSRLLALASREVLVLGGGRSTRYALAAQIGGESAQQPIWLLDERGQAKQAGVLSFLAKQHIHVGAEGLSDLFVPTAQAALPWYLSTLRGQGFLGRLLARRLEPQGLSPVPERWGVGEVLQAALHIHDAPGGMLLGHRALEKKPMVALPGSGAELGAALDSLSRDVAATLPAGSSAAGEQPKFLAMREGMGPVLVKFSPPLGTPFGTRWTDLLCAEALCSEVLARHGQAVASCELVQTGQRTYLVSERFDRVGVAGCRHVVALGEVHNAFVQGSYVNWHATCEALVRQGRLDSQGAEDANFRLQFGRLIGNTDMHSGNASLFVEGGTLAEIAKGRFELAPVYDMLPMRWRPDVQMGTLDYAPFLPDMAFVSEKAVLAAVDFWSSLTQHKLVSQPFRELAARMVAQLGCDSH